MNQLIQSKRGIAEIFESRINSMCAEADSGTLIFFKGFAYPQVRYLIGHPNSILERVELPENYGLDINALNDSWLDMIQRISLANIPLVGFYEELLALRDFLPRIQIQKIIVVENNILSPWTPSLLSQENNFALFDQLQKESEPTTKVMKQLCQNYGDVKILDNGQVLLLPATVDESNIEIQSFWNTLAVTNEVDVNDAYEKIEIGISRDWEYRCSLLTGNTKPALFLQPGSELAGRQKSLASAMTELGIPYAFDEAELYVEKIQYSEDQFVPLLKKYWGNQAEFRSLRFYKNPDISHDLEELSQGQIIAEIVDQCELAQVEDKFSNIFITAPTGSGKSILFQLPALYLAEKYNLVTIVVSPLIALMNDQVEQLRTERGISCAACINSSMTFDQRIETIERIQRGQISLVYLAPELLLTTHLQTFLGGRKVGLFVIDEAHTVTSWGRDFRSDYWFLGDFIKKCKRDGLEFPVLCLTATAVYSGEDDVVNDTINELGLEKTIIHLGNVKRENIDFDITVHNTDQIAGKVETAKLELTLQRIRDFISDGEKVLTYFPYRSQVDSIYTMIPQSEHQKIRRYHSQIPAPERKMTEKSYKAGEALGLVCTKAFGMGVDVGDIKHVLHFAPTGTLADYVQEIGRAARNSNLQGTAHIDYFPSDMRYVRALNGISEMRQYQLKEMLKKINGIYQAKKRRNLLIASETFEYLFQEKDVENKTKSGLMLLAKDLNNKYSFPVLIVRPKAMLSKNYVNVPHDIEEEFLKRYGKYCKRQRGNNSRTIQPKYQGLNSAITMYSTGDTYLVDMAAIWEYCFPDMAFGMFKKTFFEQELVCGKNHSHVAPRMRVEVRYHDDFDTILQQVERTTDAMIKLFSNHKNGDSKQFTLRMFEDELQDLLGERIIPHDKAALLLDIFSENVDENAAFTRSRSQIRILRKRKQVGTDETVYFVSNNAYVRLTSNFQRNIRQCTPNTTTNAFVYFYPVTQNKTIEMMPQLRFMELLGLASYEIRGGEKAEVFIRINDPVKISRLAESNYTNTVLQAIQAKHRHNQSLLSAFFSEKMSTEDRWELIEQFFLGNESYVMDRLHLD